MQPYNVITELERKREQARQGGGQSRVDEEYQAEVWGEDSVALGRMKEIRRDVLAAAAFLRLLGPA